MRRFNARAAAATITAVISVFLISGCSGNGADVRNVNDSNAKASEPGNAEKPAAPKAEEKAYAEMSEEGRTKFVRDKARAIINELGATSGDPLSDEAVADIKRWVNAYSSRAQLPHKNDCSVEGFIRNDLGSVIGRGAALAPKINSAFSEAGLAPQIGLYIAMIESEFCACIQSPTGPLGIYQFRAAVGNKYGLETKSNASTENPDDRCDPGKASVAEAREINEVLGGLVEESKNGSFGKGSGTLKKDSSDTVLLALIAKNMGPEALTKDLKALGDSPDAWVMIKNSDKLSKLFQSESKKYVPKFIAAAIVGENPASFGIEGAKPLSGIK